MREQLHRPERRFFHFWSHMNPGVRQLLMGGSQQWRNSLPALRAFVAANYDQPNPHNQAAMVSPPTITVSSGGTPPTGVTTAYLYTAGSTIQRYSGGGNKINAGAFRRFPVATYALTGGNVGDGQNATAWRVTTVHTGQKIAFRVLGNTGIGYRVIVDGQYASLTPTSVTTGGGNYILLDFGSSAERTVALEGDLADGFQGIYTTPGDPISAPDAFSRMIYAGDSFGEAIGATERGDGLAQVAGDMLGFKDTWQSGTGGTGYIATNTDTRFALGHPARLADVNTTGPWDVIVVAMGINDIGQSAGLITGQVNFCLNNFRKANPAAQIFVVGPWDSAAPTAPAASYTACKAAIRAGIPQNQGITFLDPEGVEYTKSDSTHPDTDGHKTLGDWLALQIKTALGA